MKKYKENKKSTNLKELENSQPKDSIISSPMVKENEKKEKLDELKQDEKSNSAFDEWSVSWP
jgi:hypothetical protein